MKMSILAKLIARLGLFMAAAKHPFDAIRLRTGRFDYRVTKAGKEIAKFTVTVEKAAPSATKF